MTPASSRHILVCGGCGFMGSQFIRHLHTTYPEYRISNLDLLTYAGNQENLLDIALSPRYEFIRGDIGDVSLVEQLFADNAFDVVINFAAESHVDRSIVDAFQFVKTNIQGAHVLLEAVRRHRVPRFVYISTDEVYGDVPTGMYTDESHPLAPSNPYAASKASADLMVQSYMRTHAVPALIVRSSNNYGPYQYPEKIHSLIITNLLEHKKIPVHGTGRHLRSWLHVNDFCDALDRIMHTGKDFGIYNIAGEERSNLEVIRSIAERLGRDYTSEIEYVPDRPGADFRYAPDSSKLTRELGWERRHSYDQVIGDVIAWYENNPGWWRRIKENEEYAEQYEKQSRGHYHLS